MESNIRIRVLIIDDHELLRSGIKVILKRANVIEVVGDASTGRAGIKLIEELAPDVVILDVKLPDTNGIDIAKEIYQRWPQMRVLVISADLLKYVIDQAASAGAHGVMLKESVYSELVEAVLAINSNKRYFCSRVKEIIALDWAGKLQSGKSASVSILNTRELEIVKLLSEGKSIREIASLINRSPKTVDANRRIVMKKLNIDSIPGLVKFAISEGLTSVE